MKIEVIYIAGYRYDIRLTRILVASIRYWYPEIPIVLVKDEMYGPYDTRELEKKWNVSLFPSKVPLYGWGFGKLEPLFQTERTRCLVLDSDIVLAGPVLDYLETFASDFVVTREHSDDPRFIENLYYDQAALRAIDPEFVHPGYTFNTGQFVTTTGLLRREDFNALVDWKHPPLGKFPQVFKLGEQGLLNYVVGKKVKTGELSLERVPMMETAESVPQLKVEDLRERHGLPLIVHWCGLRPPDITKRPRYDLLCFFEDYYYRRIPFGAVKRKLRHTGAEIEKQVRRLARGARTKLKAASDKTHS